MSGNPQTPRPAGGSVPGVRKLAPYWYPYTTMAKERWLGREILEVVSTEFRDRSVEYYRYALESGVTSINGKIAKPNTIIKNGDRIENIVHRHEPPITSTPVKIILHDREREYLVINKPGSIPVHATGRYYHHSLVQILRMDFGFDKVYTINRLDRLTSGLMIVPLNADLARSLSAEFVNGAVRKEYIARCKGEFPVEEVLCEEPLLTVDRQMGLNIVHPKGKPAKTIFNRIRYDENTHTSVIRCRPLTGRSHQIRVHLQYLGYPIANDPIYSEERIWGPNLGKGGIDIIPSSERTAPAPPPHLQTGHNPEVLISGVDDSADGIMLSTDGESTEVVPQLSLDEAIARLPAMEAPLPAVDPDTGTLYCPECYLPLHPDPKPEKLYIFLHALKYTTSLGSFETEMPEWASEGWEWEQ
ncbi:hypothetical protein ID866_6114 [Astraeus odoratus]|nr:hypothetical protein ID866_6114 [Astraeus odoratus]